MLEDLRIDAGLTYLENEPLGRVIAVPLYEEHYTLILRRDHPLAGRAEIGWSELGDVPLGLLTPDMQNRRIISAHLSEAGVRVDPRVESNSTIVLISQVQSGGIATILPNRAAESFLRDAELQSIPIRRPDWHHMVGLVAPRREPNTPAVSALLQAARRAAEV